MTEKQTEQEWVRAVRLEEAGTVLHIVLQHIPTTAAAAAATASNTYQEATYQLTVLGAQGSRAWSSSFSRDDVEEALRQDLTDLGSELDAALAASAASPCNISLHWSGAAVASGLHLTLRYERQDFVPAIFRLPPFGDMEVLQGDAFRAANARVLDVLTQQSCALQQAASLLQVKLQELASHAQRVQESYCDAIDSMAAQPGNDYTPGSILDRTAAAAAAESASKRQRIGELPLASLSPGGAILASPASRLDAAAAAAAVAGSPLPFSQDITATLPPAAAAAAAAAGGSNGGVSRPVITPSKKGKPKQLSSHERMLHRVASGHRKLQQDWNGWLRQLLAAADAAEAQQAVAGRLGQQQQQQRVGLAAAGSGQLAQQQQQQQQQQQLAQQAQLDRETLEAPLSAAAPAAAAAVDNEEDGEPDDDDDDDDEDVEIRVVHKPRARKQAGGPIFGSRKGKQQQAAREGSSGPAGA